MVHKESDYYEEFKFERDEEPFSFQDKLRAESRQTQRAESRQTNAGRGETIKTGMIREESNDTDDDSEGEVSIESEIQGEAQN